MAPGLIKNMATTQRAKPPKATPEAVVKVLREATRKAAAEADYKDAMSKAGSGTKYMDQPEFTDYVKKDATLLEAIVAGMQRVQP